MRLSKDLVAASTTPLLLSILQSGDSYGYAIIQSIRALSGGQLEWKEGMLYPLLHRLEANGLIEGYDATGSGRKRRYYRITTSGARELDSQRDNFMSVAALLSTKPNTNPGVVDV